MPTKTDHKTTSQLAKRLGVHVNTAKTLISSGEFPNAFKVISTWRIPESDITAFIDRKRQAAREERKARSAGKHRLPAVS